MFCSWPHTWQLVKKSSIHSFGHSEVFEPLFLISSMLWEYWGWVSVFRGGVCVGREYWARKLPRLCVLKVWVYEQLLWITVLEVSTEKWHLNGNLTIICTRASEGKDRDKGPKVGQIWCIWGPLVWQWIRECEQMIEPCPMQLGGSQWSGGRGPCPS